MPRRDWDYLFSEYDLRAVLEHQLKTIGDKVIVVPKERFNTDSDEQIAAAIASQLLIEPLEFDDSDISVESHDAKIDVSQEPNRAIFDRSRPFHVDGTEVTYHLPFHGDKELLKCRGSQFTMNPPRAVIGSGELTYPYQVAGQDIASTKPQFQEDLRTLKQWVSWVNEPVADYNSGLEERVRQRVTQRRVELNKAASDLGALGFRVRASGPPPTDPSIQPEAVSARRERNRDRAARQYDVALSFAGEDRDYVGRVAASLKSLGVSVFYDEFEKVELWGKDLTAHLAGVYGKQSRFVVILVSKSYAAKAWPNHERAIALGRQFSGERDRVLPVRFDNTEVPGLPATIAYLDLRVLTPEKLAELIRQKVDTEEK